MEQSGGRLHQKLKDAAVCVCEKVRLLTCAVAIDSVFIIMHYLVPASRSIAFAMLAKG